MKIFDDLIFLKREICNSSNYIRSVRVKELMINFFKKSWLPNSEYFKDNFGLKKFNIIEGNSKKLYDLAKREYFTKKDALSLINPIEKILEEIDFDLIRRGSIIEINMKKEIIDSLKRNNFSKTVEYASNAEKEFSQNKWKETCIQSRLAIEEFLRKVRENMKNESIERGTGSDHLDYLEHEKIISFGERKVLQNGFYHFLSEKGDHATKEIIDEIDAKTSLYIFYIFVEYISNKLKSKNIKLFL
jgi:hypothetical protein